MKKFFFNCFTLIDQLKNKVKGVNKMEFRFDKHGMIK